MGVLSLLLLSLLTWARPDAGVAPRKAFDVPGALERIEVPETLSALGMPVQLRAVRSDKSERQLYQHFVDAFRTASLYLPPPSALTPPPGMSYVVGIDTATQVTYVVFLQRNLDGTITVIQGEADVAAQGDPAAGADFVPLFPGASHLLRSQNELSRSVSFTAPALPPAVWDFYRQGLTRGGYKELSPGVFQKGRKLLRLSVAQSGEGISSVLALEQAAAGN